MPQSVVDEARFEEVVKVLKKRAEQLLAQEARLGFGTRFTGETRISNDELLGRFSRLRNQSNALKERVTSFWDNHIGVVDKQEIWPRLVEVETALSFVLFSTLTNEDIEARLCRSWKALDAIWFQLDHALHSIAHKIDPILSQLTAEELGTLADMAGDELIEHGHFETYSEDALDLMANLRGLLDLVGGCVSEVRSVLAGRFDQREGPGKPVSLRGDRLAAHLLGIAEKFGLAEGLRPLRLSRAKNSPPHSAADAVAKALSDCTDATDPAARAVLREAPKTYDSIVRRLIPKCKVGKVLFQDRYLGQVLGECLPNRT